MRKRLFIIGNRLGQTISWPEKTHDSALSVSGKRSVTFLVSHGHRQDEMSYEPRCELNEYQSLMRQGAGSMLYNHQTRWHNQQDLESFTGYRKEGNTNLTSTLKTLPRGYFQRQILEAVS